MSSRPTDWALEQARSIWPGLTIQSLAASLDAAVMVMRDRAVSAESTLADVIKAAKHSANECGYCGRVGFDEESVKVARGEDDGVAPCPECSPLVLAVVNAAGRHAE